MRHRLDAFDGAYYTHIAQIGYPSTLQAPTDAPIAFFPGYPVMVRALDEVTTAPAWITQVVVSLIAGALATVMIARIAALVTDAEDGLRTAAIWQVLPPAYLLSLGYSDPLFVALAAVALYLALREHWVWSGIVAGLSSAVRPTGVVLAVVGLVALLGSVRRRRSFAPLWLVGLAPVGALAYFGFLRGHTGHLDAWSATERQIWGDHEDFGIAAVKFAGKSVLHPAFLIWGDMVTITMVAAAILLTLLIRMGVPAILTTYTVGILALALTAGIATVGSFPRFAWVAFPLIIPLATSLRSAPIGVRWALGALSLGGACVVGGIVATTLTITP